MVYVLLKSNEIPECTRLKWLVIVFTQIMPTENVGYAWTSCADPGIFVRGGPGQSDKKSSDNVIFLVFLVLSLFFRSQMVNFKENHHFSRFQGGANIYQGGSNFFPGGSNCLFPIETHITCDFPGGGVRTPCPPSGSALGHTVGIQINLGWFRLGW